MGMVCTLDALSEEEEEAGVDAPQPIGVDRFFLGFWVSDFAGKLANSKFEMNSIYEKKCPP